MKSLRRQEKCEFIYNVGLHAAVFE